MSILKDLISSLCGAGYSHLICQRLWQDKHQLSADHVCHIVVGLVLLAYKALGLLYKTTSHFLNFIPFLVWRLFQRNMIVRFS